jgi:hypothetical protein
VAFMSASKPIPAAQHVLYRYKDSGAIYLRTVNGQFVCIHAAVDLDPVNSAKPYVTPIGHTCCDLLGMEPWFGEVVLKHT